MPFPGTIRREFYDLARRIDSFASFKVSEDEGACRQPRFCEVGKSGSEFCTGESDSSLETGSESVICRAKEERKNGILDI